MRTAHVHILDVRITTFGKLLDASLYEQLVNVPNFLKDIPQSLNEVRLFWSSINLRNYFRIITTLPQTPALGSLILEWRSGNWRSFLLATFILIAVEDAISFTFHYPQSTILITQLLVENQSILYQTVSD